MTFPIPAPGLLEVTTLAGLGIAGFITIGPLVSSSLGAWLACSSSGCAITTSMIGGFGGGLTASALSIGSGTIIYKMRYKKWLKENAVKYVMNEAGKLEMIPLAFIATF